MKHYDYDWRYVPYDSVISWHGNPAVIAPGFTETKQPVADPLIELAEAEEKYWIGLTVFLVLSYPVRDLISRVLTGILLDPEIDRQSLNKIFIDYIFRILKTVFNGA